MREIKFRAWGKYGNNPHKMHYDDDITPFGDSENAMPGELIRIVQENYGWIFMQYTGLKDRNGVEIYEGDIVDVGDQQITDMSYVETLRLIKWVEDRPELTIAYIDGNTRTSGLMFNRDNAAKYFEVIGNIYENPDLLKEVK